MDIRQLKSTTPFLPAKSTPPPVLVVSTYAPARRPFNSTSTVFFSPDVWQSTINRPKPATVFGLSSSSSPKPDDFEKVKIQTLDGCYTCISKLRFNYNGEGGVGIGQAETTTTKKSTGDAVPVRFDLTKIHMEPLTSSNTTIDGWMFPPLTRIGIIPLQLNGNIDPASGMVELQFKAHFRFCVGIYKAPPLLFNSILTTEESNGNKFRAQRGERMSKATGRCKLVAVTNLDAIDDHYLTSLLDLPNECLFVLRAKFSFS